MNPASSGARITKAIDLQVDESYAIHDPMFVIVVNTGRFAIYFCIPLLFWSAPTKNNNVSVQIPYAKFQPILVPHNFRDRIVCNNCAF